MPFRWNPREHVTLAKYALKWLAICLPTGAAVGSAVALFLVSLDWATRTQREHHWLLFLLPVAGLVIGLVYDVFGKNVVAGSNLIVDEIHQPGGGVPARMAPLVLLGTIGTHLFGGSAGREGTAVQMGGSIASTITKIFRLNHHDTRTLLMVGIAAGFGAVFGTPLTGAIFAMEVLAIGIMRYDALLPCLIGSIIGDWACTAWGVHHTAYHIAVLTDYGRVTDHAIFNFKLALKVSIAGMLFGLTSVLFSELQHGLHRLFKVAIPFAPARPVVGGAMVILMVYALGTRDYLGLGVSSPNPDEVTIVSAFSAGGATYWSWWWKILFTAITLGCGFKGGEVTPLFFIGATLGNTLAQLFGMPVDLLAGLGFVAVFAGATNTPLACTIMGIELFGAGHVVYIALACFMAFLFSGHSGIYLSQRIGLPKLHNPDLPADASLRTARDLHPSWGKWVERLLHKNTK